jgi:predicted DCC family thiol-disulfide oxidoreductase YuxK
LRHDPQGKLLFAPQQSVIAGQAFRRHALDKEQVDSAVLVSGFNTPQERLALRSDAILDALTVLGGIWAVLAAVARVVPRKLRDFCYRWLAQNRIRLFGTGDSCAVLTPAERARFLAL